MKRPTPLRAKRRMKYRFPETQATRVKITSNTTTQSVEISKQYTETQKHDFKTDYIDLSSR
jgi:hypothetical protein